MPKQQDLRFEVRADCAGLQTADLTGSQKIREGCIKGITRSVLHWGRSSAQVCREA